MKRRYCYIVLVVLLVFSLASCTVKKEVPVGNTGVPAPQPTAVENQVSTTTNVREITNDDFAIMQTDGNLSVLLYGKIEAVESVLGKAAVKVVSENASDPDYSILSSEWGNLSIEWIKGSGLIVKAVASSGNYSSVRGVKIGDPIEKISALYGSPVGRHDFGERIEFDLANSEYEAMMALVFFYKDGKVTSIELAQGN